MARKKNKTSQLHHSFDDAIFFFVYRITEWKRICNLQFLSQCYADQHDVPNFITRIKRKCIGRYERKRN